MPTDASVVTVKAAMASYQIINEWSARPEESFNTLIAEMKANMHDYTMYPGNYVIIIPPQYRVDFDNLGLSKQDIQGYVFEKTRVRRSEWAHRGKGAIVGTKLEAEFKGLVDLNHLLMAA